MIRTFFLLALFVPAACAQTPPGGSREHRCSQNDAQFARLIGGPLPTGASNELVDNRLGSGSDYTVFLNHLGVPVADLTFDGPYGVYHSIYDTHDWVAKVGDPGFRYHVTMVQLWGVLTLRLANADALPLDYEPYADRIQEFTREVERLYARWQELQSLIG